MDDKPRTLLNTLFWWLETDVYCIVMHVLLVVAYVSSACFIVMHGLLTTDEARFDFIKNCIFASCMYLFAISVEAVTIWGRWPFDASFAHPLFGCTAHFAAFVYLVPNFDYISPTAASVLYILVWAYFVPCLFISFFFVLSTALALDAHENPTGAV